MARRVLGLIVLLSGLAFSGWRSVIAVHWFREWSLWEVSDPSAAELFAVNFWFEVGYCALGLTLAAAGLVAFRRRK